LAATGFLLSRRRPVSLIYHVWNVVPGSVVDEDGRVGRLYSNESGVLEAVVFEKDFSPRRASALDRFFIPPPSSKGIHEQVTFNVKSLRCGTGDSDEIFDDFLLTRLTGIGWNGDGVVHVSFVGEGHNQRYIATMFSGYAITIRLPTS